MDSPLKQSFRYLSPRIVSRKAICAVTVALLTGCAAHTYVTSEPPGASISVNERVKGTTPMKVRVADDFGLGSIYVFKAELAKYKTQTQVFKEVAGQDANAAIPGSVHFALEPAEFKAEPKLYGESAETPWGRLRVLGYEYDLKAKKGTLLVDVAGRSAEVREWVVKNIGKIVSSKEIQNAGQESGSGGKYTVLKESVAAGILMIEFIAGEQ